MEWMTIPLKRYADFQGRSRRSEYWWVVLAVALFFGVGGGLAAVLGGISGGGDLNPIGMLLFGILALAYLAIIIPMSSAAIRPQTARFRIFIFRQPLFGSFPRSVT